jgi:hypothetical protein
MMSQPVGTPNNIYYKRKTFFTVLVWISTLGNIAQLINNLAIVGFNGYGIINFATAVFLISWNIKILKQKDFFFTGDLTKVRQLFNI